MLKRKIETIALVAPCGRIKDFDELNKKIEILSKNFKVKKYYSEEPEEKNQTYLADKDEKRIEYFEKAFLDSEVDLVLNIRGGYGAIRIVDKINYDLIKNQNKIYCASSDGTILLSALYKNTSIKCFHSLMLTNGFLKNLEQNLEIIENNSFLLPYKKVIAKKEEKAATGALWGGNLSSLVSLFSSNAFIPKEDIILFLEDLNEPTYKIDKMLFEIYRFKELKEKIKGIIFGDFYLEKEEIMPILEEYSKLFDVPTFYAPKITHKKDNITLPIGKIIHLK